jgi:hypothetical protein
LYTPQVGEVSMERLSADDRQRAVGEFLALRRRYRKLDVGESALKVYLSPPSSPAECIFAQVTSCVSADLQRPITPCQFGGQPDCSNCGCMASAGLTAVGRHRLPAGIPVASVFRLSSRAGQAVRKLREAVAVE